MNAGRLLSTNIENVDFGGCVKSKSIETDTNSELLRIRYDELQQLRKQVEQLESRDSRNCAEPMKSSQQRLLSGGNGGT